MNVDDQPHVQVAIIGSRFAGLAMAIQLTHHGTTDFVVLEQAGDVGGVWRDNTCPGCTCDVPSTLYSFPLPPTRTGPGASPAARNHRYHELSTVAW
jgi:cation diffusion facilitator CzcD-associated flavoprotein CzcO